jgi:hypothetical protein
MRSMSNQGSGFDSSPLNNNGAVDSFKAANHMPPGGMTAKDYKGLGDDGVISRKSRNPLRRLRPLLKRKTSA